MKFYPECSTHGATDDENIVDLLLKELYPHDVIGLETLAQMRLKDEAVELVDNHWPAIEAIAKALWAKPFTPRQIEPEPMWSHSADEKVLDGLEIVSILADFDISARLRDERSQIHVD
jgi:hypothetical protein